MITLLFFASLREAIGHDRETIALDGFSTVEELLNLLRARGENYRAALAPARHWRVAVNQDMVDVTRVLKAGDEVAIFPPVTGG